MKPHFIISLFLLLLVSCSTDDRPYSYLSESETITDMVSLKFKTLSDKSVFRHTFQARELFVEWGDGSKPSDFIWRGSLECIDTIKAISHTYAVRQEYDVQVKAYQLRELRLLKTDSIEFTQLSLTNCNWLKRLYCENQPIQDLNINSLPILEELSFGYMGGNQAVIGISQLKFLRMISVHGNMSDNILNLTTNDSLRMVSIQKANLVALNMNGLERVEDISIDSCTSLIDVNMGGNRQLKRLAITNNASLESAALDKIFESLPQSTDGNFIYLKGNKGDNGCNKSLATAKGWAFVVDL